MKNKLSLVPLFLALVHLLNAQSGVPVNVPPPPSPNVSVSAVGFSGFATDYYMVIANYPSGQTQSAIVTVPNANPVLSSSNFNQLGWQGLPGALTFDVLKLPSASFTGTCTCSLVVGQAATTLTYKDIGGSLSSYTASTAAAGATATVYIDNLNYAFPKLRALINLNGGALVNHLAEVPSGTVLPVYATAGDLFIENTGGTAPGCYIALAAIPSASWTSCGSAGGSAVVPAADCGVSAGACADTVLPTIRIVKGIAAATSASPSTVSITGMPAFTSTTSYSCYAEDATTAANLFQVLTAGYVSTTAVTFTGPNTVTDTIRWHCIGN